MGCPVAFLGNHRPARGFSTARCSVKGLVSATLFHLVWQDCGEAKKHPSCLQEVVTCQADYKSCGELLGSEEPGIRQL